MSKLMLMLGMGASLLGGSAASSSQTDSLIEAARMGACSQVEALLRAGADPDERDEISGWTPLMYALEGGHREVALVLLRARRS